jgi:hypothetical protein
MSKTSFTLRILFSSKPCHSTLCSKGTHFFSRASIRHTSFPSNSTTCMPRFTMKCFTKFASLSNPFFPHRIIFSMFSSSPHPSADFKTMFSTSSHTSSTLSLDYQSLQGDLHKLQVYHTWLLLELYLVRV